MPNSGAGNQGKKVESSPALAMPGRETNAEAASQPERCRQYRLEINLRFRARARCQISTSVNDRKHAARALPPGCPRRLNEFDHSTEAEVLVLFDTDSAQRSLDQ